MVEKSTKTPTKATSKGFRLAITATNKTNKEIILNAVWLGFEGDINSINDMLKAMKKAKDFVNSEANKRSIPLRDINMTYDKV